MQDAEPDGADEIRRDRYAGEQSAGASYRPRTMRAERWANHVYLASGSAKAVFLEHYLDDQINRWIQAQRPPSAANLARGTSQKEE